MKRAISPAARLLVCGNLDRCDDGAAVWAAESLLPSLPEEHRQRVDIRRCGQLDIEDLLDASSPAAMLIIDTCVGVPPGTIVTRTFDELLTDVAGPAPHSSHALPIAQVVGVARQLSDKPVDGLFVGIGGFDFGFGSGLSDPVRRQLPDYVAAIGSAIARLTAAHSTAGG
jgi:hydrogenase maturation protease